MNLLSHFLSSFLAIYIFDFPATFLTFFLTIIFSVLPDIDGLWAKSLYMHHRTSIFHAPLFWIFISGIFLLINYLLNLIPFWVIYLLLSLTLLHLFTDFITGRTCGVLFLYPFSRKEFSLFSLHPHHGNFKPRWPNKEKLTNYLKYYFENKLLLIFEILISIGGLVLLILLFF